MKTDKQEPVLSQRLQMDEKKFKKMKQLTTKLSQKTQMDYQVLMVSSSDPLTMMILNSHRLHLSKNKQVANLHRTFTLQLFLTF